MDIYVPDHQRKALAAIDRDELDRLLDEAIDEERLNGLQRFNFSGCGSYVSSCYDRFQRAFLNHRAAKSAKKRAETKEYLQTVKRELTFGVRSMLHRIAEEMEDEKRFRVEGELFPPSRFTSNLTARVRYQWRKNAEDDWTHGSILFTYDVDLTPRYGAPRPKRKPSAARQFEETQAQLSDIWNGFMESALYSVRDYFRQDGSGDKIPDIFSAKPGDGGYLNNYSTVFWPKKQ